VLEASANTPLRASDDWSITPPGGCACALCKELAQFLADPRQQRLDWPLAKEKRSHVHQKIDASELPVTHTTIRSGSPYTLVLQKTLALFEREAKERAAEAEALAWLARTANAFAPSSGHREVKSGNRGKADGARRRAREGLARRQGHRRSLPRSR
jgi:hypothetical protein